MKVEVLLFARLREVIGRDQVSVQHEKMLTVRDVWDSLRTQYPQIDGFGNSLIFSVNQEFADFETPVTEGDEIALFPPVSGGQPVTVRTYTENEQGDVLDIVRAPIRPEALVEQLQQPEDGAVVVFSGVVRNHTRARKTLHLEYEAYEPMALKKMGEIEETIRRQWPVTRLGIVHRLGRLEIGEASVVIVVTSAHRQVAFEACQFAIDTLKKIVPIWKKEFFADGEVWVEGQVPP
jgi:molybdopterin converting factor subunit 1